MSAAEAEILLRNGSDAPCVRYYRRRDGTVVTTDRCGNRIARTWWRLTAALGALLVGLASLAGCDCSKLGICTQGKLTPPPGAATNPPPAADADEDDESE